MRFRAIDIETYIKKGDIYKPILNTREFVLGGLKKDTAGYHEFTSKKEMSDYIIKDIIDGYKKGGEKTYYYGHSMAYDFYGTFADYLDKGEIIFLDNDYKIQCFSLYPFIAYFIERKTNKTIGFFLDSMSFYRCSLDEVGKMIGLPKLEMPETIKNISELSEYLKRDCEVVMEGMLGIKKMMNDMGYYPKKYLTAGNVSITNFLTYCRKTGLSGIFQDKGRTFQGRYMEDTRNAFRGGRCECFQKGFFEKSIKLDINSAYPYIMTVMKFPDLRSEFYVKGIRAKSYLDRIGVINCSIQAPSEDKLKYAYLPIRFGGNVHFPFGRLLKGTWTTLELRKAIELGYVIKDIDYGVFYKEARNNPFRDYVLELYKGKKNSKDVKKQVYKLLLNSLYGKWGQKRDEKEHMLINRGESEEYFAKGWEFVKTIDGRFLISINKGISVPKYANPMLSLLVTAQARDLLWENMMKIPKKELIYVATDCLLFKPKDLNSLESYNIRMGDELGEFSIEDMGDCLMYGENRYKINDDVKIGGIPKRDRTNKALEEGQVIIKKMISIKQAMKSNMLRGKVGTFVEEVKKFSNDSKNDIILPMEIDETRWNKW